MLEITPLPSADLDEAGAVVEAAFSRPGMAVVLRRNYSLQPEHWFCARQAGVSAGVVGAYRYGPCASIGMLGVRPDAQRQGVGLRLMSHLIDHLEAAGCREMFLEASAAGAPRYPRLGFAPAGPTLRRMRAAHLSPRSDSFDAAQALSGGLSVRAVTSADWPAVVACDAAVFGLPRPAVLSRWLTDYAGRAYLAETADGRAAGFLVAGPGSLGPWVADAPSTAEALLRAGLALPFEDGPRLTCPGENAEARALLAAYGFVESERLTHMCRRGVDRRDLRRYYGQASLALG